MILSDYQLERSLAIVTGGTRGIGLAICHGLMAEGCNVVTCSRGGKDFQLARAQGLHVLRLDATMHNTPQLMFDFAERTFAKKVNILINNVGGGGRWKIETSTDWAGVMDKNLSTAVRFTDELLSRTEEFDAGRVVTISSIYGREAGGEPWFAAAKAAQIAATKGWVKRQMPLEPDERNYGQRRANITFNVVAPGHIGIKQAIDMTEAEHAEWMEVRKGIPRERYGTPEEVANVVVFLCSHKAAWINGACIVVDGGESRAF